MEKTAGKLLLFSGVFLAVIPGVLCEYNFSYGGLVAASIFAVLCLIAVIALWIILGLWPSYYHKLQTKQGRVRVARPVWQRKLRWKKHKTTYIHMSDGNSKEVITMNDLTPRGEQKAGIWAGSIPVNHYEEKSKTLHLGEEVEPRIVEDVTYHNTHTHTHTHEPSTRVISNAEGTTYVVQTSGSSLRPDEYRATSHAGEYRTTHVKSDTEEQRAFVLTTKDMGGMSDYRSTHHGVSTSADGGNTMYIKLGQDKMRKTYAGSTTPPAVRHDSYHVHAGRVTERGGEEEVVVSPGPSTIIRTSGAQTDRRSSVENQSVVIVFDDEDVQVENPSLTVNAKEGDLVML